jgi:hypothetical protein
MRAPSFLGGGARSMLADFSGTLAIAVRVASIPRQSLLDNNHQG